VIETDTDIVLQRVLEPDSACYFCLVAAVQKLVFLISVLYSFLPWNSKSSQAWTIFENIFTYLSVVRQGKLCTHTFSNL